MISHFVPFPRLRLVTALAVAAVLTAAASAHAAHTDWAVNEGGRMRLILLEGGAEGGYQAALQIEPKPGWITYWREPGDSGIPPQVTVAPGSPYHLEGMAFPVPVRMDDGSLRDVGYDGPVTLLMRFSGPPPGGPAAPLDATAFIGLCKNICIPFQADFSVSPPVQTDVEDALVIAEAKSRLPEGPSATFSVRGFSLAEDHKTLHLDLSLPETEERPQLFVTGPAGTLLMDYEVVAPTPGRLSVTMPVERLPKGYDPSGRVWLLLAKAGTRAMEAPLVFE